MMMRALKYSTLLIALTASLPACADYATTPILPNAKPPRAMEEVETGWHLGEVSRTCAVYKTASQDGHGYSVWVKYVSLFFPRSEMPANGATRTYHYRGYSRGPTLAVYADCEIPATDAALRRTDRFFGVARDGSRSAGDLATTQECITVRDDGTCELEGITTETCQNGGVYPDCNVFNPVDYDVCYMLNGCGGGTGDWYGDPGGTSGGWTGSPNDGSEQPPCERDANGACKLRPPAQTPPPGKPRSEWEQIGMLIDGMKDDTEWCRYAKQELLNLYNQGRDAGRFKVWDGVNQLPDGRYAHGQTLADASGPVIAVSSYWLWNDSYLLVHEGLHMYWNANAPTTGTLEANDPWIYEHQYDCL